MTTIATATFVREAIPTLHIHGSTLVYTDDTTVTLEKANPQGINPTILLMNLNVVEGTGPRKGVMKPFSFHVTGEEALQYLQVQIVINDSVPDLLINVRDTCVGDLVGRPFRTYVTGDIITEDYVVDRVNIETDKAGTIVSVWFG